MKPKFNMAQIFLGAIGVDSALLLRHHIGRSRSHTKKGPGRVHQQGKRAKA